MSLDKNKHHSPSHSLPLSPSPLTLRVCRCISCCPAATVSLPMQTDFPMTLSNMLICSCQRLFVRLDRICEVRCSARNACRRTGSFPASVCSSSLVFLLFFGNLSCRKWEQPSSLVFPHVVHVHMNAISNVSYFL